MKQGYLIIASERRVLNVVFSDELDAIQQVLGCAASGHGTTFHTEDQLLITGDELDHTAIDRVWVAGVPFHGDRGVPTAGDVLLIIRWSAFRLCSAWGTGFQRRSGSTLNMRASERSRNARPDQGRSVLRVASRPVVPADIKYDIASVVATSRWEFAYILCLGTR
jgi:hypothetical protein